MYGPALPSLPWSGCPSLANFSTPSLSSRAVASGWSKATRCRRTTPTASPRFQHHDRTSATSRESLPPCILTHRATVDLGPDTCGNGSCDLRNRRIDSVELMPSRRFIGEALSTRSNSLNFLRLVLALTVLVSHAIGLSGHQASINYTVPGTIAVYGFFGISGYLIAGSAIRTTQGGTCGNVSCASSRGFGHRSFSQRSFSGSSGG